MGYEALGYLFPGQGSQREGMAKRMLERKSEDERTIAGLTFEEADDILGFNILNLCLQGSSEVLKNTRITQPAIFTTSIAALRIYDLQTGDKPTVVAGHSLGEYSALVAAGFLTFADALRLVQIRGKIMEEAGHKNSGKMVAVLMSHDEVFEICHETGAEIANINSPRQIIISGNEESISHAVQLVSFRRGRAIPLDISIASHSSMMREAQSEMTPHIRTTRFSDPDVPIVPNVYPQLVREPEQVKECLIDQMTGTVRWQDGVEQMINSGVHRFVEIGPGEVLTNLMKRIDVTVEMENTDALFSFQTEAN